MENWDDPLYDGLTHSEKEALHLHIVVSQAVGPGGRLTKKRKWELRDAWLLKRQFDALPGVQEMKAEEALALRQRCRELWTEIEEFVERVADPVLAKAVIHSMDIQLHQQLSQQTATGWEHLLGTAGQFFGLDLYDL